MVACPKVAEKLSLVRIIENLVLYVFVAISILPIFVILVETIAGTLGVGLPLPASFIPYINRVTGNTIILALTVIALSLLVGIPAGFFLARLEPSITGIFLILLTIPLAAPSLVSAIMVRNVFERTGFLYMQAARIRVHIPSIYGSFGLALAQLMHTIPYTVLLVRAGFLAIPRSVEELALSLGASPFSALRDVLIPFVFPHILTACTMMLLYSLGDLGAPLILGGPYKVFSSEIYVNFISNWGDKRVPLIFAVWAMFVFLAALFIMARIKALALARPGSTTYQSQPLQARTRLAGIAFLALLSFLLTFPFMYVLLGEVALHLPGFRGTPYPLIQDWSSVKSTMMLALIVVPPMLAAAIFIANAIKAHRHNVFMTGLILAPAVLPGVLLGFGLLRSMNAIETIAPTTPMLVAILGVALVVRGLPYVVIVLQSAINASTIPLEDSAKSLGASPWKAFITVTMPQIRPVLAVAAVVGIFTCVTELSASLIIYPPGWQTMSMFIAYYMEEGLARRAVFMAFLLLFLIESMLVLSGILSARSARLIKGTGLPSRDRMVFLTAFAALEPGPILPTKTRRTSSPRYRFPPNRMRPVQTLLRPVREFMKNLQDAILRSLGHAFGYKRLREENAALREELTKAEYRRLSMQINPHFFFNTLNTLVSLVQKDQTAAIGTIGKLASLFRYALDALDADTLPLSKEIEYVRTYLEIEKMRFGNKLHYTVLVPDELFSALIPPLLIQPLVENAIKYGKDKNGEAYLVLSIHEEHKGLVVIVSDYGTLTTIPEMIANSEGTGIRTVRRRVEAIANGSIWFHKNEPQGLCVEIRLPLRRNQ